MSTIHLTEKVVEDLLKEDKVITANLIWRPWGRRGARLDATVLAKQSGTRLKLYGYYGPTNRSFSLLCNSIDIRRLCLSANARHTNADKERFDGLHKHRYDEDAGESREAYKPEDIHQPGEIDVAFMDFLQECKITLEGTYQPRLPMGT